MIIGVEWPHFDYCQNTFADASAYFLGKLVRISFQITLSEGFELYRRNIDMWQKWKKETKKEEGKEKGKYKEIKRKTEKDLLRL